METYFIKPSLVDTLDQLSCERLAVGEGVVLVVVVKGLLLVKAGLKLSSHTQCE